MGVDLEWGKLERERKRLRHSSQIMREKRVIRYLQKVKKGPLSPNRKFKHSSGVVEFNQLKLRDEVVTLNESS